MYCFKIESIYHLCYFHNTHFEMESILGITVHNVFHNTLWNRILVGDYNVFNSVTEHQFHLFAYLLVFFPTKNLYNFGSWVVGVTLEDPRTEDLSQEVRGFIFSKILVCSNVLWSLNSCKAYWWNARYPHSHIMLMVLNSLLLWVCRSANLSFPMR